MSDSAKVGAGGTAAWLFEKWSAARRRDQAVVLALRRRYLLGQTLIFVIGGVAGALANYFF
jgi:hypothetical protein